MNVIRYLTLALTMSSFACIGGDATNATTPDAIRTNGTSNSDTGGKPDGGTSSEKKANSDDPVDPRKLEYPLDSLEDVAGAFLESLAKVDEAAMYRLRVTKREYMELIWPESKTARHPRNTVTPLFAWRLLNSKCVAGMNDCVKQHGGRQWEFLEVTATGGVEEFDSFRLHRRTAVRAGDPDTGEEVTIECINSILELDGQFKILGFRD